MAGNKDAGADLRRKEQDYLSLLAVQVATLACASDWSAASSRYAGMTTTPTACNLRSAQHIGSSALTGLQFRLE